MTTIKIVNAKGMGYIFAYTIDEITNKITPPQPTGLSVDSNPTVSSIGISIDTYPTDNADWSIEYRYRNAYVNDNVLGSRVWRTTTSSPITDAPVVNILEDTDGSTYKVGHYIEIQARGVNSASGIDVRLRYSPWTPSVYAYVGGTS